MRETIGNSNDESMLNTWIEDVSLPDDHVIAYSLKFVDIMNEEGFIDEQVCRLHIPMTFQGLLRIERCRECQTLG